MIVYMGGYVICLTVFHLNFEAKGATVWGCVCYHALEAISNWPGDTCVPCIVLQSARSRDDHLTFDTDTPAYLSAHSWRWPQSYRDCTGRGNDEIP